MDLTTVTLIILGTAGALLLGMAGLIKTMILWRFDALERAMNEKFTAMRDSFKRLDNQHTDHSGQIQNLYVEVNAVKSRVLKIETEHGMARCFYQPKKEIA